MTPEMHNIFYNLTAYTVAMGLVMAVFVGAFGLVVDFITRR